GSESDHTSSPLLRNPCSSPESDSHPILPGSRNYIHRLRWSLSSADCRCPRPPSSPHLLPPHPSPSQSFPEPGWCLRSHHHSHPGYTPHQSARSPSGQIHTPAPEVHPHSASRSPST